MVGAMYGTWLRRRRGTKGRPDFVSQQALADRVFCGATGRPLHPTTVQAAFARLAAAAGLPRIRFHDMRHSYATLMLQAGENPKVVSATMGHASVAITLNVYSHVSNATRQAAAARLEALVEPASVGQPTPGSPIQDQRDVAGMNPEPATDLVPGLGSG